jgi:hypothetical protein
MSLSYLNHQLKLDENLPPAYVIGRMEDEGILENGAFYDVNDNNNKLVMTVGYRLNDNSVILDSHIDYHNLVPSHFHADLFEEILSCLLCHLRLALLRF